MSGREWADGTVAMVTQKGGSLERLSLRRGREWLCDVGSILDPYAAGVRPLVVIDPASPEHIERLGKALYGHGFTSVMRLQAALREFADPPKPEEPTGLGAVVEDEDGRKYVRVAESFDGWMKDRDWQRIGGEINAVRNFGWADIDAVRVLSEGVVA